MNQTRIGAWAIQGLLATVALFHPGVSAAAPPSIYAYSAVKFPSRMLGSNYARSQHTDDLSFHFAQCPPGDFLKSGATCIDQATGVAFNASWVIVDTGDFPEYCEDMQSLWWWVDFTQQNTGLSGSGTLNSHLFIGDYANGVFSWYHAGTYQTNSNATNSFHYSETHPHAPRYLLFTRSAAATTYPDPLWQLGNLGCNKP